jgi:hypothetical protein
MPDQLRAGHDFSCNDYYCQSKSRAVMELYGALQDAINRALVTFKAGLPCAVDGVINRGTVDAARRAAAAYKGDDVVVVAAMKRFLSNPRKEELATFPREYTEAFDKAAMPAPVVEAPLAAPPEDPPMPVLEGPVVEAVPTLAEAPVPAQTTALVPVTPQPAQVMLEGLGETTPTPWYQNKWVWIGGAAAVVGLIGIYVIVKSSGSGRSSEAY